MKFKTLRGNFRPRKSLGQHFLTDENIARKIVQSLALKATDTVIEIGSGMGILTKYIFPQIKSLIAVELDRNLSQALREQFGHETNFQLVEADFLKVSLDEWIQPNEKLKIVGNIPYHLTSPVIFKVFEHRKQVQRLTLMVQKEVAQRIVSPPNSKRYGILSVLTHLYAECGILFYVSRNVFAPKPKVDSAVIQWDFLPEARFAVADEEIFSKMLRGVFRYRRKMLRNSLSFIFTRQLNWTDIDFDLKKRPEELSVEELVYLSNVVYRRLQEDS